MLFIRHSQPNILSMKTIRIILVIALTICLSGCTDTSNLDLLDLETVKSELTEFESTYSSVVDSRDIDAILEFYSDDLITISPDTPIQYGADWIRDLLIEMYEDYELYEKFSFVDIRIIADRVVASFTYTQKMTPIAEGEEFLATGTGSCVLKKSEKGIWQFEWNTYTVDSQ